MEEAFDFDAESEQATDHNRGDLRDSMLLQATMVRTATGEEVQIRVRNLSSGGLMAECTSRRVKRGDAVSVVLRGVGDVDSRVAWVADGRIGLSFLDPVDPKATRKPVGPVKKAALRTTYQPALRRPGFKLD